MKRFFKTMAFTLLGLVLSVNLMAADTWEKLTSVPKAGDVVILVNETGKRELTGISSTSTKYGIATTYSTSPAATYPLTVCAGSSDGTLAFKTSDDKYLTWTSGNSLNVNGTLDAKTSWTVSVSDGNFTITNANTLSATKQRYLKYNNGSNQERFACYESGQQAVQIYKKQSSTPTEPVAPSITTQPEGATYEKDATATALSVEASGNPTPTYQWYSNTTESTSGASAIANATNASYIPSTAAIGTKYYYCVATNTQGSATSDIVAVTVTAALPKITITADQVTDFTNSYKEYTWTASDVSGKLFAYKQNGMQFNVSKDGYYVCNTDPIPGNIRSIKMTTHNSGTERDWDVWVSKEPITNEEGEEVKLDKKNVAKAGTTWDVSGSYQYFYLQENATSGASNISEIVITYEEDKTPSIEADVEEIEFEQKELEGTVTDSKVISVTGKNLTAAISASMKEGSDAIFSVVANGTPTAAAGEFTVSYSTTEAGEYAGTVVLKSGETSIEIPVSASVVAHIPVLQSIAVSGTPTKTEYTVGDAFETAGLVVTGTYDVGEPQTITEGIEWEVDPEKFETAGTVSVDVIASVGTIMSGVFTVENINVVAAPLTVTYDFESKLYGHSGVSSGSNNHDGDVAENEIFTESPTQIKFTKSGSTVTRFWKNNTTQKPELRIYSGAEYTISSENYNIIQIVFAGTDNVTFNSSALSNHTWTGKQKSVSFGNGSSNSALTSITVTYQEAAPSAVTPTITPSDEAETYWEPITVTLATTTEGAAIYYTTDGTEPTTTSDLYEGAFQVSNTTTVKAIAVKDGLDNSEVATKTFNFGPIFTSLEALAAADLTKGTTVKVSFSNVEIKSIFTSGAGKRQGIFFNIQKGGKDIEIYYASVEVPETWVAEGTVSGTMICPWTEYNGTWELAPAANSWNWSNLTYNAPAVTGLTKVEVEGTPDKTTYVDGEKFNPAGLTIYATINNVRAEYDGSEGPVVYTVTPETLTEGTTSVSVVATIGTISSEAYIVNGLTVNAIQQSTIADFISNEGGRCYLVGEITSAISNGSFTLTDASGSIYVYKHTLNGVTSIAQGDYIKVIADEYEYYNNKTHEAKNVVVIEKPEKPHVDVTGISLDKTATTITVGKTETLVATIEPADASDKEVIWTSSNEAVATVAGGVVTAKVAGSAVITAKSHENEEITATCTVTVVAAQVKYFALATSTADLDAAVTNGKKVVIAPAPSVKAAKVMGTYVSGNNIAAMDADFNDEYSALEVGEEAFYTIAKDGSYYTFQDGNGKYIYAAGGTGSNNHLKAKTDLEATGKWTITIDATTNAATIKTSDETVARHTIMFNSTLFSCYASGQSAVALYVEAEKPAYVPVENIELNETSAEVMVGKKITLTATVGPDNATQKGVTWTSNNDKVTVVDGLVTVASDATVGSTATITATTIGTQTEGGDDHLTATCTIKVTELTGTKYGLVSNINTLYDGAVVVLGAVYERNSETKYAVSGAIGTGKFMASVDVAAADYADEVMFTADATEITLHKVAEGWTMTSDEGNIYLSGADVKVSTTTDATIWTISIAEGKAVIKNGDYQFFYNKNSGSERFKPYNTTTQEPVGIYMKNLVAVRTGLTVGKIGTICYPQAIAAVDGANLYQPNYKDDAVKNIYFSTPDEYSAGLPMIFQADREIMKVLFTGDAVTDPIAKENARGMVGNLTGSEQTIDPGMYIFTQNKLWITGEGCIVDPNRAYVDLNYVPFSDGQLSHDLPSGAPRRTISLGNASASTPTNLNGLNGNMKAQKVMKDGQFYIIREAKMYNAQGIEVQ